VFKSLFKKNKLSEKSPESAAPSTLWHKIAVSKVVAETADATSVVLDMPEELSAIFSYKAGQFLTFRFTVNGEKISRCYSMSSSPVADTDGYKVTVKRVEDGRASNWINDNVKAGIVLEVMKPGGLFCLEDRDSKLLLFSGGSGITPCISILKTALQTTTRQIHLVYANRDQGSIIFHKELTELAAANPDRLSIAHRLDDTDGYMDNAAVQAAIGGDTSADFYICGPGPFMDTVEGALHGMGIQSRQIFIERFSAAANGIEDAHEPTPATVSANDAVESLTVEFDGQTKTFDANGNKPLLFQARDNGIDPPSACEEGFCGCCIAKLLDGTVHMGTTDALSVDDLENNMILTCQAVPTSKCVSVKYPD
jgi:3-ketosteroid 9alpha-monooxygenase subunit B